MARMVLLTLFCCVSMFAQESLEFEVRLANATVERGRLSIEVLIPVDQLRFVDDGTVQLARFTVEAGGARRERRVTAPRETIPEGTTNAHLDVAVDRETKAIEIVVTDENARLTGRRTIIIAAGRATVESIDDARRNEAVWRALVTRAQEEKKPLVIFFRTHPCARCKEFERLSVPHPAIQRRLPAVLFATLPARAGEEAHVALFDRAGTQRVRWPIIPDTTNFGIILDSVVAVAPHFERAVQLAEAGRPHEGDLEAATAYARLGRTSDARAALARAEANGVTLPPPAPAAPKNEAAALPRIRLLPPLHQVVSGRQIVRTHVASDAVARVTFSLDGREVARVERPPFSATLDFGAVPQRHSVRVVAFDGNGGEIGRDERVVNEAGEAFWLRITAPAAGYVSGSVRAVMNLRAPATRRVRRVIVSWNDAQRALLTKGPWEASIVIPEGQVGVLRAVAELDDGRTSEDAVLLNAGGAVDRADVQLVELPITITGGGDITADRIRIHEGNDKVRRVESVATAAETPLTIGMLIDVSGSMQRTLPDLQEAAIRFLETTLGERDRAFLVAFDSRARLVQPATADVALLRRQIMTLRPEGLTALHDAMVLGLLQFEGIPGRRAMIVFSDGHDVSSRYGAPDVSELARRVNVPIHVISSRQGVPAGMASNAAPTDRELKRVSQATGGTGQTLQELAELPAIYARIEAALRAQILAFVRTDPAVRENEWRPIRVVVRGGSTLTVHAPEGYYAPW